VQKSIIAQCRPGPSRGVVDARLSDLEAVDVIFHGEWNGGNDVDVPKTTPKSVFPRSKAGGLFDAQKEKTVPGEEPL
jgi:hypothetical protein